MADVERLAEFMSYIGEWPPSAGFNIGSRFLWQNEYDLGCEEPKMADPLLNFDTMREMPYREMPKWERKISYNYATIWWRDIRLLHLVDFLSACQRLTNYTLFDTHKIVILGNKALEQLSLYVHLFSGIIVDLWDTSETSNNEILDYIQRYPNNVRVFKRLPSTHELFMMYRRQKIVFISLLPWNLGSTSPVANIYDNAVKDVSILRNQGIEEFTDNLYKHLISLLQPQFYSLQHSFSYPDDKFSSPDLRMCSLFPKGFYGLRGSNSPLVAGFNDTILQITGGVHWISYDLHKIENQFAYFNQFQRCFYVTPEQAMSFVINTITKKYNFTAVKYPNHLSKYKIVFNCPTADDVAVFDVMRRYILTEYAAKLLKYEKNIPQLTGYYQFHDVYQGMTAEEINRNMLNLLNIFIDYVGGITQVDVAAAVQTIGFKRIKALGSREDNEDVY